MQISRIGPYFANILLKSSGLEAKDGQIKKFVYSIRHTYIKTETGSHSNLNNEHICAIKKQVTITHYY